MSETKDWLAVGAKVAAVSNDRRNRSVRFATVERIGKRDVVLNDGQRFSAKYLTRQEGGTYGWSVVLLPADDPAVAKLRQEIYRSNLETLARSKCREFALGRGNAFDVILALAPLTGVADEIAALDAKAAQ